jgi:hypothetical protein
METILEQQRRSHEERERLVKTMVDENMMKKGSVRDQIYSDHRTKIMLDVSTLQFSYIQYLPEKTISSFPPAIPLGNQHLARTLRRQRRRT